VWCRVVDLHRSQVNRHCAAIAHRVDGVGQFGHPDVPGEVIQRADRHDHQR
jgi:hypothetical protein